MEIAWTEIPRSYRLQPGDLIQIELRPRLGWLGESANLALIAGRIYKLEEKENWEVKSWTYLGDSASDGLKVLIKVNDNMVVQHAGLITSGVIIAAILGISAMFISSKAFKMTDRIGEIVETPGGRAAVGATSAAAFAVFAGFAWYYMRKK